MANVNNIEKITLIMPYHLLDDVQGEVISTNISFAMWNHFCNFHDNLNFNSLMI